MTAVPRTTRRLAAVLGGVTALILAAAGCAPAAPQAGGASGSAALEVADTAPGDITPFCPAEPTKVMYVKSAGGHVWEAISHAEFAADAAKCPTVEESWYNGTSGQQGAIAATNAAVAQGAKVMVISPDFGDSQLPSMRKAMQAGVQVVSTVNDVNGQKGVDYVESLVWDTKAIGEKQAEWLATNVKTGKVAFLGGQPGAPSTQKTFDAFKEALGRLAPQIQLVPDTWVATNWDAGQKRRAVAGLLAQNGDYAAFVSDYGASDVGAVQAILDAKAPMPAFLNIGSSQAFVCLVQQHNIPWLGQDGTTRLSAASLRIGLAALAGKPSPEPVPYELMVYADTAAGKTPTCDPSVTPDADLSSSLSVEALKAVLGGT
ncbi:substrate-binding domain-containing protein [Pseudonocardia yuanmonensis]|uniref:substrate-binding domain-containing protein n=1 Tax=Pseudonocardia yuanmonensis TaxID=1095914 RepID=UPI0031E6E050